MPPPLLFLHGLFGTRDDWDPVISHLKGRYPCIAIDLPKQGIASWGKELLVSYPKRATLIGYSMGGRIALKMAHHFQKIILISSHLNRLTQEEKKKREVWEEVWKEKLRTLNPRQFFTEWYHQPLFDSLNAELLDTLIEKRSRQDPKSFLSLFSEMSLLQQPPFSSLLTHISLIYGEKDSQYQKMYRNISTRAICIPDSGHMCHLENPKACAEAIQMSMEDSYASM